MSDNYVWELEVFKGATDVYSEILDFYFGITAKLRSRSKVFSRGGR